MLRAKPLITLATIAVAAACTDQPEPTAPTRPNAILTYPDPAAYAVKVDPPVILEGLAGSNYDIASGVNAFGDVAGVSTSGGALHAVRWPAGSVAPNDVAPGTPHDINTAGQLVGEAVGHAALWTPDGRGGYTLTRIGEKLPSAILSTAYGVNANGQVVGTYRAVPPGGAFVDKCFLWTPDAPNSPTGTVTTLPDFGGSFCVATDVNSAGYVVGAATLASGETHAFLWSPPSRGRLGKIRDLTPGGGPSYATSINDVGQVAGQHTTETAANAAIWTPTASGSYVLTDLGTFTGTESFALDINESGFVVGFARRIDVTEDDAFLWQNGEFTLLPGTAPISEANGLTSLNGNSLQIIGNSSDAATGARTPLRWTVTVAPPSASPK